MKRAIAAGVLLALTGSAGTGHAQFRGALTSRPSATTPVPRPSATAPVPRRPVSPRPLLIPMWWQWGLVMVPDPSTLTPPVVAEGAPGGGVQLDVVPWSAQVYVDGALAGRVEEFRGYYHHLELPAGPHVIAIVTGGTEPLVFDVMVVPGKTITYRGSLR